MMATVAVESIVISPSMDGDDTPRPAVVVPTSTDMVRPPRRTSSMHATIPSGKSPEQSQVPERDHGVAQPTDWGQNFWVTLIDPQTQAQFYACPSTGQTTWDAPVGNFVLPPSSEGEWWELRDETRDGIPYYYHTKSGDTTWNKPDGFVIPLGVVQNTSLGRKLSQSTRRHSQLFSDPASSKKSVPSTPSSRRNHTHPSRRSTLHASPPSIISEHSEDASGSPREPAQSDAERKRERRDEERLPERCEEEKHQGRSNGDRQLVGNDEEKRRKGGSSPPSAFSGSPSPRSRSKSSGHLSASARTGASSQSLTAAIEFLASSSPRNKAETSSAPDHGHRPSADDQNRSSSSRTPEQRRTSFSGLHIGMQTRMPAASMPTTPTRSLATPVRANMSSSPSTANTAEKSPRRTVPALPLLSSTDSAGVLRRPRRETNAGMSNIGKPVLDPDATRQMNPLQQNEKENRKPIHVATKRLSTGEHPLLPRDLVSEIQQFAQSDFARRYFSTHREGLIFRRKVPVERMMMWQKSPLTSPLLVMNKSLHRDAVRVFKVIQRIMGDRDRDRPVGVRHVDSSSSLTLAASSQPNSLLEEERWLLGEGLLYGEMRDEIYCQIIKQLSGNNNTESTFRGWQVMCVLLVTFPPSKNFEPYVRGFMQQHTTQSEGRVDVMAKYCLHRLNAIAKKGPRGKPPTIAEIENASDAAFNPSTFGESLDAVFRLQARTYANFKVPVILPFLADGILALGGTKQEGIFRVPGDSDAVSGLRLRINKGVYTLDGIDDPHVLASLFKLWLRELLDPLVPEELYNECVQCADDPKRVVAMVGRLPTINRRVVLFVISFLQLFLEERVQQATKMTSANLALVMAPNLLRCDSDSMSVVFTNAQYEQRFVHNLLVHLRCDQVDPDYIPEHGRGAVPSSLGRKSHQKSRRPKA